LVVVDALPTVPTQELPKLPENTPPWIFAVVYSAVAIIVLVGFLGRYLGNRGAADKKKPDPPAEQANGPAPSVTASVTGTVAQQAEASQALMERLVAGLEKRLDTALSTQEDIARRYEAEIEGLRSQLSTEQQSNWRLSGQMQNLQHQLEDARNEVVRLRAELAAVRSQRGAW
jgi:hypothetical protein